MSDASPTPPLLEVENLSAEFRTRSGSTPVLSDVSFDLAPGEILGLVGESGSGKTVTSMAISGLLGLVGGRATSGSALFAPARRDAVGDTGAVDVLRLGRRELSDLLGDEIAMIFQQPSRSLNPTMSVGEQIAESVRRHQRVGRRDAWRQAVDMLDRVEIPNAAQRAKDYPHVFSGGMQQRVMIAMALVNRPRLVIADEPTTALDVTVQARVLDLLLELQADLGMAVILISHDMGVINKVCQRVAIMYCGQVVEIGAVGDTVTAPRHPYTAGLIRSMPSKDRSRELVGIPGVVPPPTDLPGGCRFHPRCSFAEPGRCDVIEPELEPFADGSVRCLRAEELVGLLGT